MGSQNLAARAGRWSAAHWKTATFGWIAFVAVAVAIGQAAGTVKLSDAEQSTGEASRAQAILQSAGFSQPAAENVLVQSRSLTVSDPAFRATIARVSAKLHTLPQVQNVLLPSGGAISKDRHAALVQFSIAGKAEQADTKVQPVLDARGARAEAEPGFTVAEFGFASANHELNNTLGKDFQKAELLSVPITFAHPPLRLRRVRRRRRARAARASRRCSRSIGLSRARQPCRTRLRLDPTR